MFEAKSFRRFAAAAMALGSAIAAADSLHVFPENWKNGLHTLIPIREMRSYAQTPEQACSENPQACGNTQHVYFRVPDERMLEVLVAGIRIRASGSPPQSAAATLHFSAPAAAIAVALERTAADAYQVGADDQAPLAAWLADHIDALNAGEIAIERVDGLHWAEILIPPQ